MATRTPRAPRVKRTEFKNVTQGYLGAVKIDRKGDDGGIPVPPGERIFLNDEEIELTEQAHVRAEDSPFHPREIIIRDPLTFDVAETFVSAPLARVVKAAA